MRALIINPEIQAQIKNVCDEARKKTLPWSILKKYVVPDLNEVRLSDRKPGSEEVIDRGEQIVIPNGYLVMLSFEEQPDGIMRHLSVSLVDSKKMPSPEAVDMILSEFGFDTIPMRTSRIWMEEFEPGRFAINVCQLDKPHVAGHA